MLGLTIKNIFVDTQDRDMKKQATVLNMRGNNCFKENNFKNAVDLFTQAIELNPTATYFVNRSTANRKLNQFGCALDDATKAIDIDPKYYKGYSRRADAYMGLEQYSPAIKDYESAIKMNPTNTRLPKQIAICKDLIQQEGNLLFIDILHCISTK